ncbi:MAG: hypothetical protein QM770_13545 [Tepidisphaeraceae bacterium]
MKPIRWLHVPSSIVGGVVGLAIVQTLLGVRGQLPAWMADALPQFRSWAAPLIALVFAGVLMEKSPRSEGTHSTDVLRQGLAAWIVVLGQVALGLIATALWIGPSFGVPGTFGQLIEVGMAGGPGTARAMGEVYARQFHFDAGTDLGLFVATFGLVWGVFSGIALVNIGHRLGWPALRDEHAGGPRIVSGIETDEVGNSLGTSRVRADVLDPLMLQLLWLVLAFAVGMGLQWSFGALLRRLDAIVPAHTLLSYLGQLPLFLFTMAGGWIVRETLHRTGLARLLDLTTLQRLTGVSLELLIVTSLTGISLSAIRLYFVPVAVLLVLGSAWCVFNLVWVSPRLLPKRHWFELGLMNYGFATATTPQSILLLKMVDRDLKTGAAEVYAAAVPLSAPFVGGGVLTLVVFPLLIERIGTGAVGALCVVAIIPLWLVGRRLVRRAETRS